MKDNRRNDSVFSRKLRAGKKRTYFFDVRQTRGNDYYVTLTESTRKFHGDRVERHKIFLYKEDFNRFQELLNEAIEHVKNDLMPNFDYEEFDRRQEEWEARQEEENNGQGQSNQNYKDSSESEAQPHEEDDMSW